MLILLFYVLVICKLRTVGPKNKSKEKKKSHRKVTYLVLTVITVYVFFWLPYWIGQVYITFLPPMPMDHSEAHLTFLLLTGCLSYANSAVNPILYAFLSENFKKSFAKAFTCAAGHEVNAQLHVENSVLARRSSRGTDRPKRERDRDRLRDPFGETGDTQAFSNFVVQESQEMDLDPEVEMETEEVGCGSGENLGEPSTSIVMMSRTAPHLGSSDTENLLTNGCHQDVPLQKLTQV